MNHSDQKAAWDQRWLTLKLPPLLLVELVAAGIWSTSALLPMLWVTPLRWAVAAVFGAAGLAVCVAGVWAFRQARTTVSPVAPENASALVVRGIYRWTRNPMYLGFVLGLLGWSLALGTWSGVLWCAALVCYLQRYQIRPEEAVLRQKFGADYVAYCAQVGRWWGYGI